MHRSTISEVVLFTATDAGTYVFIGVDYMELPQQLTFSKPDTPEINVLTSRRLNDELQIARSFLLSRNGFFKSLPFNTYRTITLCKNDRILTSSSS